MANIDASFLEQEDLNALDDQKVIGRPKVVLSDTQLSKIVGALDDAIVRTTTDVINIIGGGSALSTDDLDDVEGAVNTANGVVKIDGSGNLPALNGSALTNTEHTLGGANHTADTLANLNLKISDATLFGGAHTTDASLLTSGTLPIARLDGGAWTLTSNLNIDSNTLVVDQANNRVGIGTTGPRSKTEIVSGVNALANLAIEENYHLKIRNPNDTTGQGIGISFGMSSTGSQQTGAIVARRVGANGQGTLEFYTKRSAISGVAPVLALKLDEVGNVGIGTASPAASALLDMVSTTKGLLIPRVTTAQKDAISLPAIGLQVFDTSKETKVVNTAIGWKDMGAGWYKFTFNHTAFQTTALNNDIELFSLPAGGTIERVMIKHSTAFAGTSITEYTISVGISGDLAKYASAFDVLQAVSDTTFQLSHNSFMENFGAATSVRIAATSVGANLDQSTAGDVEVWVQTSVLQ